MTGHNHTTLAETLVARVLTRTRSQRSRRSAGDSPDHASPSRFTVDRSPTGKLILPSLLVAMLAGGVTSADAQAPFEGTLIERHGDTLQGTEVDKTFIVANGNQQLALADPQPSRLIGQQVLASDSDPSRPGIEGQARAVDPHQHLEASPAPGPQTVLVLVLTTPDATTPAVPDLETARQRIFTDPNSAGEFYAQQSQGATTLTGRVNPNGDVLGPIALNTPMAGCPVDAIAAEADQRATAMGDPPGAYDHVIYLMPGGHCPFGGLGELPGHRVWSSGYTASSVISHELGHNMGAHHANLDSCVDPAGAAVAYSNTCSTTEYGDPFDVMGRSGALMGAFHRYQIGELPTAAVVSLHQSATVAVSSADDLVVSGPRLLLVPIKIAHQPVHDYFAIDARTALSPFDQWVQGDPITTGLTIRKVNDSTGSILQTQLINTHPSPSASFAGRDAPLQPGETFTDAGDNISITAVADSSGALQATVSMPALVDDVPPTAPGQVTPTGNTTGVHISWTPGTDDVAVDHYALTRNGVPLGVATGSSFDDPNVRSLTQATYGVSTVDTSGNVSPETSVGVGLPDVTPPTAPTGLQARRNADGTAVLTWLAATDNRGVSAYRIEQDGRNLGFVPGTSALVSPDHHAHGYAVYARDAAENESGPATVVVPEQQVQSGGNGGGTPGGQGSLGSSGSQHPPTQPVLRTTLRRMVRVPGGHRFTVTFRAPGATGMRVLRGTRRIGMTHGAALTVSVVVAARQRATLTIVVSSAAGNRRWTERLR